LYVRSHHQMLFLTAFLAAGCESKPAPPAMPPPQVLVTPAIQRDLPIYVEAIGQTRGSKEVQIQPRVSGFLQSQDYKDGSLVSAGQLLYTIDPRPYVAALAQANGQLAQSEAQLQQTRNDVARYVPLAAEDAISRQQLDNAKTSESAAAAAVEAARANVDAAKINLNYTRVTSPVRGQSGITTAQVGSLVGTGQGAALTVVSTINPFWVRFTVSEREYLEYRKRVPNETTAQDAQPEISITLADNSLFPFPGKLTAIEGQVDPSTGSLTLQAEFPNPNDVIRPGQYARVQILSQIRRGAVLVPQRAVQEIQGAYSVVVVGDGNKTEERNVSLGNQYDAFFIIESGVKPGEKVIVEGVQKVRNGMTVAPKLAAPQQDPSFRHAADSNPKPAGQD
jgi:membrane fusion protein (multidrug efflux system)